MLDIIYDFDVTEDQIALDGIDAADVSVQQYRGSDVLLMAGNDRMILRNTEADAVADLGFLTELDFS